MAASMAPTLRSVPSGACDSVRPSVVSPHGGRATDNAGSTSLIVRCTLAMAHSRLAMSASSAASSDGSCPPHQTVIFMLLFEAKTSPDLQGFHGLVGAIAHVDQAGLRNRPVEMSSVCIDVLTAHVAFCWQHDACGTHPLWWFQRDAHER